MIKKQIMILVLLSLGAFLGVQTVKSMETEKEKTIKSLPKELLEMISRDVIRVSANLEEAIKNFKNFAQVLALSQKINLFDEEYKKRDIINLFSAKFRVPPLIVAKKLGIGLSDESKKELRKKAIYRVLSRYNITEPELEAWLEVNKDRANEVFTAFMAKSVSYNVFMTRIKKINERETLIAMAAALIYTNVDPDIKDKLGSTSLKWAAEFNYKDIVELLLNAGADPNIQNKLGLTALMKAATFGHKEIIELLLNAGTKIDVQEEFGRTALMKATIRGHKEIVKLLINSGAKLDLRDHAGKTALSFTNNPEIADLLKKYSAK